MVKYIDMDKIFIKDVPAFCKIQQKITGNALFRTDDFLPISERDLRIPTQELVVAYSFEGFALYEDHFYLKGFWRADLQLKCTYCQEPLIESFEMTYDKLRLIGEHENSLDYNEDCQECRFDFFDLRTWIFSEMMLGVPISPKHSSCALPFESIHMANL
jgi:uncharacterized metal-binding protein YceD (DUF177 family)